MNDKVSLSSFPKSKIEALTMLYLQNQDLSDCSPEQLADKYKEVFSSLKKCFNENSMTFK